jgi:PAS domain S-box-containing protein
VFYSALKKWFQAHVLATVDGFNACFHGITAWKYNEEQHRFLSTILQYVNDSVIVTDLKGTITWWNNGASVLFGYPRDEMMGKTIALLHPKIDVKAVTDDLDLILQGKDFIGEWKGRRKDGTIVWADVKTTVMRDSSGNAIGLIGIAKDVTERREARERLQQSEKHFRALIEHGADAIMLLDQHTRILYASPSSTRILGYSIEELVGRFSSGLFYPDHRAFAQQRFSDVLQQPRKIVSEQFRLRHKDGTLRWVEGIGLNLLDDPAVGAVVVNFRDNTERKLLEAELQTAKKQLEAIFQNIDAGILVQDAHGAIIYVNQAAASMAGYSSVQEMQQAPALSYWDQFDILDERGYPFSTTQAPGRRALQGETVPAITLCLTHKQTREMRWVMLKSTAIAARDQVPALVITIIQDVTQFKELDQRKDEFIMHVSHELRTPLTAVSGYLALLKEHHERFDAPTQGMFLDRALENCDELTLLVNTILEALYISGEVHVPHYENLSLSEVVREVLTQLDPRQKAAYSIEVQLPGDISVRADRQFLQQILRNLFSNAFKYVPQKTPITLSAQRLEGSQGTDTAASIYVRVQDAGPGIPPAEQPLLFQKFTRLKRDLSGTVRGTGLGLHNCKKLVEAMGGQMWVESTGKPGEGSCFCFTLHEISKQEFTPHSAS